jgi:hypothetical protein
MRKRLAAERASFIEPCLPSPVCMGHPLIVLAYPTPSTFYHRGDFISRRFAARICGRPMTENRLEAAKGNALLDMYQNKGETEFLGEGGQQSGAFIAMAEMIEVTRQGLIDAMHDFSPSPWRTIKYATRCGAVLRLGYLSD